MTRQSADEVTVKCNASLDQTEKTRCGIAGVLDKSALAIRNASGGNKVDIVPKVKLVVAQKEILKTKLERIMSEIHDIENNAEREKPVKIDLDIDLYQMEKP